MRNQRDLTGQAYFLCEAEVEEHVRNYSDLKWVIYRGIIYDVKEYISHHPGGTDLISRHNGKSIDDAFES